MNINKPLNREKSRAGMGSAEHDNYRATLKQAIRNLTVLLVMLITGSAGAWADELDDINSSLSVTSGGTATATGYEDEIAGHCPILKVVIKVTPTDGYYTKLDMITAENSENASIPQFSDETLITVDPADATGNYGSQRSITIYWGSMAEGSPSISPYNIKINVKFAKKELALTHTFGSKATVTFFDGGTDFAPAASLFDPTKAAYADANAITSIDNLDGKDHYIIVHIVPAADYWTDISQLQAYETMPYSYVTARKRESASGSDIGFDLFNTLTLLKKDEYNAGTTAAPDMKPRCDGAGWYYYTLPKEHTIDAKYTASTIDGFMIKKFDFSSDNETNVSQSGKVISIKNGEGWTAELELDDIDFPFTGENIGPTFASITIKKDSETDPAFILTDQTDITIAQQLKTPLKNSKMIGSGVPLSSNAKNDYTWFRLTNFFSEEDPYSLVMNSTYSIIVPFNGSGTVGDPWKINNAEDLVMLGKCVNIGNYPFEVEYLVQTADIDMSGTSGFTPIGLIDPSDAQTSFAGNYNGRYDDGTGAKDHFISGITYTNSTAPSYDGAYSCMGLFGEVGNTDKAGTIQNLTLKDCSFKATASSSVTYAGGIAGNLTNGTISNCYVKNTSIEALKADCFTGAILGNYDPTKATLSNNYYTYDVTVTNSSGSATGYTKRGYWTGSTWDDITTNDGAMLYVKPATITVTSTIGSTATFDKTTVGSDCYDINGSTYYYAVGQNIGLNINAQTTTNDGRTFSDELTALTMNDGTNNTDIKTAKSFTMPDADAAVTATFTQSSWFTIASNGKKWMTFYHDWKDASNAAVNYTVTDGTGATTPKTITVNTITAIDATTGGMTKKDLDGVSFSGVPTLFNCDGNLPAVLKFTPETSKTAPTNVATQFKGVATATALSGNGIYIMNGDGGFDHAYITASANTLAAHRCYIDLGSAAGAARLYFVEEAVTSIGEVTGVTDVTEMSEDWYTLDGRRLNGQPTRKGIYIYKGKKTVVK